jgi:acyl-coenzyme A synthetase/AMP-(fatty) acid ligase
MAEQRAATDVTPGLSSADNESLPLLAPATSDRPIALRNGSPVVVAEFRRHVAAIVRQLPPGAAMINLCEDRYRFLAAFAAAVSVGHTVLLPPSRAEQVVGEIADAHRDSYRCDDAMIGAALASPPDAAAIDLQVPAGQTVMIGFTSGSTGQPRTFPKQWRTVCSSTARNARAILEALQITAQSTAITPWLVATVPPQHMYGMELSVLLPLIGGMAIHEARPLFPADIAAALEELPAPRVLVSTPVHLRTIVESEQSFPRVDVIVSATAPLSRELAAAVERKLGGTMLELFGSTETCVFAHRRTTVEDAWQLYEGVQLAPGPDATLVNAPWFVEPVPLQDVVDLHDGNRFVVRGRNTDMVEVAGKRASLSDLTRRLLAIEGVRDAAVFQPDHASAGRIRRVAALVVAPGLTARGVLDQLATGVDAAFLPRPLVIVDALPRNELGKIPREALLKALRKS